LKIFMNDAASQIALSEFPELLQQLLSEVQRTGAPLSVTQNGEPLVIVYPAPTKSRRAPFGIAKGSGQIIGDIVEPVLPESAARNTRGSLIS
jgi:prevent-host-death family protein